MKAKLVVFLLESLSLSLTHTHTYTHPSLLPFLLSFRERMDKELCFALVSGIEKTLAASLPFSSF